MHFSGSYDFIQLKQLKSGAWTEAAGCPERLLQASDIWKGLRLHLFMCAGVSGQVAETRIVRMTRMHTDKILISENHS